MRNLRTAIIGGAFLASTALSGCYAEVTSDAAYADAPTGVVDIESHPQYSYQGQAVYLVDDRWYTRRNDHWVYYREEPEELHRHRVQVQAAPPAPRRESREHDHEHHGEAPRARRVD